MVCDAYQGSGRRRQGLPQHFVGAVAEPAVAGDCGAGQNLVYAARIVTELKDKIVTIPMSAETNDFAKGMDMDANEETAAYEDRLEARAEDPNLMEDAISALVNLGYQRLEAYRAVSKAMAEGQAEDVSSLIRLALKEFANKEI